MTKKRSKKTTKSKSGTDILVDVTKTRAPDRVMVSLGSKIPGPKQYTTHDVNMSFESNVQDGEKPEDAIKRVSSLVKTQFEDRIDATLEMLDAVILNRASQGPKR